MQTLMAGSADKSATTAKAPNMLTIKQVMHKTGLSQTSIYELMAAGKFPRQRQRRHTRGVYWREDEIDAWIWEEIESSE